MTKCLTTSALLVVGKGLYDLENPHPIFRSICKTSVSGAPNSGQDKRQNLNIVTWKG